MKRLLLMLGLPALMGMVWFADQQSTPTASAEVTITTDHVIELRGAIISRLNAIGAVKTSETTSYADDGNSDLTFRVPPAKIEQMLTEIASVGGTVTEQHVELENLSQAVDGLTVGLDGIDGCLGDLASRVTQRAASAADISKCQAKIALVNSDLENSAAPVKDAIVAVHVQARGTTSPLLFIAVILLAIVLATMAYLTFRSAQIDRLIDVRESKVTDSMDELYIRRN